MRRAAAESILVVYPVNKHGPGTVANSSLATPSGDKAAHIWPYRGPEDNHPENGLLLRADIHTLFDLDHLAVDPDTLTIRLSPALEQISPYGSLAGVPIKRKFFLHFAKLHC